MEFWIYDFGDHFCLYCNDNFMATFLDKHAAEKCAEYFKLKIIKNGYR